MSNNIQIMTVGGGCFWCTEAVFQEVKGVKKVFCMVSFIKMVPVLFYEL